MKKTLLLISIGLLSLFFAGCTTGDTGTAGAEQQSAPGTSGSESATTTSEQRVLPIGNLRHTQGEMEPGVMSPGLQGNLTLDLPMPPEGMNGTPVFMPPEFQGNFTGNRPRQMDGINGTPGSMPPQGGTADRPDVTTRPITSQ